MTLFKLVWLNLFLTMAESLTAYLGFGSNLGDRLGFMQSARQRLDDLPGIEVVASSDHYRSAAVGGPADQPDYLNAVVAIRTNLQPKSLLDNCLDIEQRLGRIRLERWGTRTIDIDLLLFGSLQCDCAGLTLPHPRLHERPFVLYPLNELAPNLELPGHGVTIAGLVQGCKVDAGLTRLGPW